MLAPPSTT